METHKWLPPLSLLILSACSSEKSTPVQTTHDSADANAYDYVYRIPEQIHDNLETGDIREAGIDLNKINAFIDNRSQFLHSLLIYRYGKLVLEEYFEGEQMKMTSPIDLMQSDIIPACDVQ